MLKGKSAFDQTSVPVGMDRMMLRTLFDGDRLEVLKVFLSRFEDMISKVSLVSGPEKRTMSFTYAVNSERASASALRP